MEKNENELRVPFEDVTNGKVLVLPFSRNNEIWHAFERHTQTGERSAVARRTSYVSMVTFIAANGDDGNFFGSKKEAEARVAEMKRRIEK